MTPSFFILGVAVYFASKYFPVLCISISAFAIAFLLKKGKTLVALFMIIGAAYAFYRDVERHEPPPGTNLRMTGYFTSPGVSYEGGFSQEFKSVRPFKKTFYIKTDRGFDLSKTYVLDVKTQKSKERLNPSSRGKRHYAVLMGIKEADGKSGFLSARLNGIRERIGRLYRSRFDADSSSLLLAITTGERSGFTEGLRDAFGRTGLAHLLSISGTHFGLFFMLLFALSRASITRLPDKTLEKATLYVTPSEMAAYASMPVMLFYLGMSGANIPSLRAFVMITLFLAGLLMGRKGRWLNFLLIAALLIIAYEPDALLNLSFQLSFIAVFFIGWIAGGVGRGAYEGNETVKEDSWRKHTVAHLRGTVFISLAATLGVAPLVAYHFHYFSVISPLANLIATPIVGFLLVPLSLLGAVVYLLTGSFYAEALLGPLSKLVIGIVNAMSAVPYSSIKIPGFPVALLFIYYAGIIVYLVTVGISNKRGATDGPHAQKSGTAIQTIRKYGFILPALPFLIYALYIKVSDKPLAVTFLDAGHADTSVIETPDGKTFVIDTGKTGREAAEYLKLRGRSGIDALVLTHAHEDHAGGLEYLSGRFEIEEIWDGGRISYPEGLMKGAVHRTFQRGDSVKGKGFEMLFLHPYPDFYTAYGKETSGVNNDSLVFRLQGERSSFLFAGDVEAEAEWDLTRLGGRLRSDVLKVPHHGAASSSDEAFFGAVSPRIAAITSWRKPGGKTLDALGNAVILQTGINGAIKIEDGLKIKTYAGYGLKEAPSFKEEIGNFKKLFARW